MRFAALVLATCLGLTGCATVKSWFAPSKPAGAEEPEERARRAARPAASSPQRASSPVLGPPRPATAPLASPATPPGPADATPPVLSPVLSAVDEQRLRAEAQQRIDGTEQRLRQVDQAKLASGQQESLQTVQSFLDKAREALQAQDVQRAFTLADKAYALADELAKRPR